MKLIKKLFKFGFIAIIGLVILGFLFKGNEKAIDTVADYEMDKIEKKVAQDFEEQYNIALKNGTEMDAYVAAGQVAAGYLQNKDEENYAKWKAIEKQHGKKLGL